MDKLQNLNKILKEYKKVCIAYSGGTDSDFLLNAAVKCLGKENVLAIIGNGIMLSRKDYDDAVCLAKKSGADYEVIDVDAFAAEEFVMNRRERCYFCKKNIMSALIKKAAEKGFDIVCDGKNTDDAKVFRPGAKAAAELGLKSPLYEAGFSKSEIRSCSKEMGCETWDKKSNSCLATRFPYDTHLTKEMFEKAEKAELAVFNKGYMGARVRVHGDIARVEIAKDDFERFIKDEELIKEIKNAGFKYVTLDLEGFRSGSMD